MAATITLTVQKMGTNTYSPALSLQFDPNYIKFVQPEFTDAFVDRALVQYYDNQKMTLVPLVTTETVDAIRVLATASVAGLLYYKVVSTFNRKHLAKLCLLNINDGVVNTFPLIGNDPQKANYDMGERNHAAHAELAYCSYPLTVVDTIVADNAIVLACCVDNFMICGTAVTVGGSPFTVLSSSCDGNTGTLVLNGSVAGVSIGDEVELT